MRAFVSWIDDRTGLVGALRKYGDAPLPGGASWRRIWPSTILFAFGVQLITGLFLWMYYSPSAQSAWESVYFLQYHVTGGWLLRAVHHYSAHVMLVLIGLYLIQMIGTRTYRAPRELVFWATVFMGLICLGLLLTGDLLAWDRNSYASTQVRVSFLTLLPGIGGSLYKLAAGGPAFGHLTLTRFLALHAGLFSATFLVLLVLHNVLARRADTAEAAEAEHTCPFWPNQAVRNAAAGLAMLVVVLLLADQHGVSGDSAGVALGSPADPDPANFYAAARPEWAFLGLYAFSHLFPGELMILPIFVIPGLLLCLVLAMPWIGRPTKGHWFNVALTAMLLAGIVVLSLQSVAHDRQDDGYRSALKAENERAKRVRQLAQGPQGIPASGALALLRNDPKTQGPILFKAHCAGCHDYANPRDERHIIKAEEPSAPNLFGYATRKWVFGWLHPETIVGSDYFGNTKLKRGEMVDFIRDTYDGMEGEELDELQQDLRKVAAAVSAEAGLRSQYETDREDSLLIEEGRELLTDDCGCIDCHKFHDQGSLGDAPDLTGYGSRQWTIAIISNPAHKRFYRETNDRMPGYAEFPEDPAKNALSDHDLCLLSDWLRSEWYRGSGQ